jgi:hypothetical protein
MSRHTPGPWKFNPDDDEIISPKVVVLISDGACGDPECCGPATYTVEIKPEDGRLIEAGPKMLEACIRVRRGFNLLIAANDLTDDEREQIALLDEAIALATGA